MSKKEYPSKQETLFGLHRSFINKLNYMFMDRIPTSKEIHMELQEFNRIIREVEEGMADDD